MVYFLNRKAGRGYQQLTGGKIGIQAYPLDTSIVSTHMDSVMVKYRFSNDRYGSDAIGCISPAKKNEMPARILVYEKILSVSTIIFKGVPQ